jgi:hypothetical protein
MLNWQGNADDGYAHTVGISWPGDLGVQNPLASPGQTIPLTPALYFHDDEYRALQMGVPLARKLGQMHALKQGRTIDVYAHSLGNMVVNSALTRPELPAGAIANYVMNEAAIPGEAFVDSPTVPEPSSVSAGALLAHATENGYPDDVRWLGLNLGLPIVWASPPPSYGMRWRQTRGTNNTGTVPDASADPSTPHRGAWQGFFANNRSRTHLVNTFSKTDRILSQIWFLGQLSQTPDVGRLGVEPDLNNPLTWALLPHSTDAENYLWSDGADHSNIVRQWTELAYWFPALMPATGNGCLDGSTVCPDPSNVDLTPFDDGSDLGESHSYMLERRLSDVWLAFKMVRDKLQGGQ